MRHMGCLSASCAARFSPAHEEIIVSQHFGWREYGKYGEAGEGSKEVR